MMIETTVFYMLILVKMTLTLTWCKAIGVQESKNFWNSYLTKFPINLGGIVVYCWNYWSDEFLMMMACWIFGWFYIGFQDAMALLGYYELLSYNKEIMNFIAVDVCDDVSALLCENVLFILGGYDMTHFNQVSRKLRSKRERVREDVGGRMAQRKVWGRKKERGKEQGGEKKRIKEMEMEVRGKEERKGTARGRRLEK